VLVAVAVGETVSCDGVKLHVEDVGSPEQAKVTVPVKLLVGTTLMVAWAEVPAETVRAAVEALKPKVGVAEVELSLPIPAKRPWASLASPAVK